MKCPRCGYNTLNQNSLGVELPGTIMPRIFEIVEKTGPDGIDIDCLYSMLYAHKPRPPSRQVVKQHVARINDLLAETDWKIYGKGGSYKFVRRKAGE